MQESSWRDEMLREARKQTQLLCEIRDALCGLENEDDEVPAGNCPCLRKRGRPIANCPLCRGTGNA